MLLLTKLLAVSSILTAVLDNCIIKTTSSNAESREEQDGSKQNFLGQIKAELQAVFHLDVARNMEKR